MAGFEPMRSWRHLLIRAMLAARVADAQGLLEDVTSSHRERTTTVQKSTVISRPLMPKSPPTDGTCNHCCLVGRGNQHARWWTCVQCKSRWPRAVGEQLAEDAAIS